MRSIHILLVEDNEGDILLTMEALEEGKIANKVSVAKDGSKAIEFLDRASGYIKTELPDLILLDVNLPRKNGFEVLDYIKSSEQLKQIPVIMLTTSSSEKDMIQSYKSRANGYVSKPLEADDFAVTIKKIREFWIKFLRLRMIKF